MTGTGDSDLHWRWTQTPEERLLARAGEDLPSPSPATTAEASGTPTFVYIPLGTALKLFGPRESLAFQIRVPAADWMPAAQDQARLLLRARHHLSFSEEDDFGLITPVVVLELWESLTGTIAKVAVVVMVVFLVMGGLVIMNIMLAIVSERTWEIGLRKTMGASKADVRLQFLTESACLSLLGGLLGVALAFGLIRLIAFWSPVPAGFSLEAAAGALVISGAVGLFFGIYPASRAASLDPIAALRAETG